MLSRLKHRLRISGRFSRWVLFMSCANYPFLLAFGSTRSVLSCSYGNVYGVWSEFNFVPLVAETLGFGSRWA